MCIATNSHLLSFRYANLRHRWLGVKDLLCFQNDLIGIFLVYFLSVLKPFNHVCDEFLGHLLFQTHTVVFGLDSYVPLSVM